MNLQQLRESGYIKGEILSGSHLYGLNIETSDEDFRGIFMLPLEQTLKMSPPLQIQDEKSDTVFYELGKFIDLAAKSNPNILELLYAPDENILQTSDVYKELVINRDLFLTKQCKNTFAGYAISQIKKARGLNKNIFNPEPEVRKTPAHFCYIIDKAKSIPLLEAMTLKELKKVGVAANQNGKGIYSIFEPFLGARGLINEEETSNGIRLSSIPKETKHLYSIYYNMDGYVVHCKNHRKFWEWVEVRNQARYDENTEANYDRKNMMHTFRLLNMGIEILRDGVVNVKRPDREFLLSIRHGQNNYESLLEKAELLVKDLDNLYETSKLPDKVDLNKVNALLVKLRLNN